MTLPTPHTAYRVLCLDPGPHIGIATWSTEDDLISAFATTPEDFYVRIWEWVRWADQVVCENFVIGGKRGSSSNETIEHIGIIKYCCYAHSVPLKMQPPGAHRFATAAKFRRLGWTDAVRGPDHIRSAAGHLMLYLAETGALGADRLLDS